MLGIRGYQKSCKQPFRSRYLHARQATADPECKSLWDPQKSLTQKGVSFKHFQYSEGINAKLAKMINVKLNIQKAKIMASGPITSWLTDEEKVETVTDFIFLGSKITVAGDYSCEIKTLALWKKNFDKPRQHIKKQRHHFANKHP